MKYYNIIKITTNKRLLFSFLNKYFLYLVRLRNYSNPTSMRVCHIFKIATQVLSTQQFCGIVIASVNSIITPLSIIVGFQAAAQIRCQRVGKWG